MPPTQAQSRLQLPWPKHTRAGLQQPSHMWNVADVHAQVVEFINKHGRRPPRSTPLGTTLHRVLKSTATSSQAREALHRALAGIPSARKATVIKLQQVRRDLTTGKPLIADAKRFRVNQDFYVRSKPAAASSSSVVAKRPAGHIKCGLEQSALAVAAGALNTGRPRKGVSLQGADPIVISGIPIASQSTVDFLHQALHAFSTQMQCHEAFPWFVTWGTLLGLHRDGGFIPYDVDVDVAVVCQSLQAFTSLVPALRLALERLGFRIHPIPAKGGNGLLQGFKIAPATAKCDSLFSEVKARLSEDSLRNGLALSRASISHVTKKKLDKQTAAQQKRLQQSAIGFNTVDVEVALLRPSGGSSSKDRWDFVGYPKLFLDGPLTLEAATFGRVQVFKPTQTTKLLKAMYPKGYHERVYQHRLNGHTRPVPPEVPLRLDPTAGIL